MSENDYTQELRETVKELIDTVLDLDLIELIYKLLLTSAPE